MDDGHFILLPLLPCHLVLDFFMAREKSLLSELYQRKKCVSSRVIQRGQKQKKKKTRD